MGFSFSVVLLFAFERLCDWRNQPKAAILVVQLSSIFLAQLCRDSALADDIGLMVDVVMDSLEGIEGFQPTAQEIGENPVGNDPAIHDCILLADLHVVQVSRSGIFGQIAEILGNMILLYLCLEVLQSLLQLGGSADSLVLRNHSTALLLFVELSKQNIIGKLLVIICHLLAQLYSKHSTANVHAHDAGDHPLTQISGKADDAAGTGMYIGHDPTGATLHKGLSQSCRICFVAVSSIMSVYTMAVT